MDEKELLTEPRFLKGRILEEHSKHVFTYRDSGTNVTRRETLFYCEDFEKCITLFVDEETYSNEFINKRVSAKVKMDNDNYCCDTVFYIFEKGHDELMTEVEHLLELHDNNWFFYPTEYSQKAVELYHILTLNPVQPIPLSLFIEGYKEPEDNDLLFNRQLQSIRHHCFYSNHPRLYGHILHQWAIYNCYFVFKDGRYFIAAIEGMFWECLNCRNQEEGISEFFKKACSLLSDYICYGEKYIHYPRNIC